jgi:hypothetical protein
MQRLKREAAVKRAEFGLAKSEDQASSIINQLKGVGFPENDISVLLPDKTGNRRFAHVEHNKALEGAALGGGIGVVLGGVVSCLMGLGILAIPGVGPLVGAGPIIAALAGAGAAAVAGGVIGSIIGMRMPEFEAVQYQGKMDGGNILISVLTGDATERDHVRAIFNNAGSVTAAEAVVDHAYGRLPGSVGAAMRSYYRKLWI